MRHKLLLIGLILINFVTFRVNAQSTPTIDGVTPADGAVNVPLDTDIALNVTGLNPDPNNNGGAGVAAASLTIDNVYLYKTADGDGVKVPANYNGSGGGDIIILSPIQAQLDPNSHYTIVVTERVTDTTGAAFVPFTASFTTGSSTQYNPAPVTFMDNAASGALTGKYTSMVIGPDNRLYGATSVGPQEIDGQGPVFGNIRIYNIALAGQLIHAHTINTLAGNFMAGRIVIGLAIDPTSTPDNPILWVTSNDPGYGNAPNFSGKVHRLTVTGHNTSNEMWTEQTMIVGLPRSIKDHMTNSLIFGPDGGLYNTQGGITAMGGPDGAWGRQPETLLSAAILRIDTQELVRRSALPNGDPARINLPLDVSTGALVDGKINDPANGQMLSGASNYGLGDTSSPFYNPLAPDAIVTLYATGVRNAYDLVWHSNGQLYVPGNGSASGGNRPTTPNNVGSLIQCQNRIDKLFNGDYTGPSVGGGFNNGDQRDYLFRITQGGYYGHPNPTRCEWVMNGGNSASSTEDTRVPEYTYGTEPDRNYRVSDIFSLDYHKSPNGVIEYKSNAFNGALKNKLLVIRYSENDDILVITVDGAENSYNISQPPMTIRSGNWYNPLDLVEDVRYGNLYISEYMNDEDPETGRIRLLRAQQPPAVVGSPNLVMLPETLTFSDSIPQRVEIRNTGTSNLTISSLNLAGANANQFQIIAKPFLPMVLAPDQSTVVTVKFQQTTITNPTAELQIASNDPDTPTGIVPMNGNGIAPTVVQLIRNPSFEVDVKPLDRQPDRWSALNVSGDRILCNTVTLTRAAEGNCAYRFKGALVERSMLVQQVKLKKHQPGRRDTLDLSFQYSTNRGDPKLIVRVLITYANKRIGKDGIVVINKKILTPSENAYTFYQVPTIQLEGAVESIQVMLLNRKPGVFMWVDDLKLLYTDNP